MVTDIKLRIAAICNEIDKFVHDEFGLDLDVLKDATLCVIIEQMAIRRGMHLNDYYKLLIDSANDVIKECGEPNERY